MIDPSTSVRVRSITWEATDVHSHILVPNKDKKLADFEPVSHIDVIMPNRLMRSYSFSAPCHNGAYRITVARDANSSGGSAFLAEQLRPGQQIKIGAPRSDFPVCEDADLSVFIAGGIGVTPFLSMAHRLNALERPSRLRTAVEQNDDGMLFGLENAIAYPGQLNDPQNLERRISE